MPAEESEAPVKEETPKEEPVVATPAEEATPVEEAPAPKKRGRKPQVPFVSALIKKRYC